MLRNTTTGYGLVAILFHWVMAALMLGMFALGLYMHNQPITDPGTFALYQWHKSFGMVVLALAVLRLAWRFANPAPKLPEDMHPLERLAAKLGHAGLYAVMLAIPVSGWFMVSASPFGIPTILFDVLPVPHLPVPDALGTKAEAEELLKTVHKLLAFFMIFLVAGHVAAALKHHFLRRDDTLKRMVSVRTASGRPAPPKTPALAERKVS